MNLDDLRKEFKLRHRESIRKTVDTKLADEGMSYINDESNRYDGKTDISLAFISNNFFYLCYGETEQKLKIPLASFKDNEGRYLTIDDIFVKINSLQISSPNKPSDDCSIYKFCKTLPDLLKLSNSILIFYSNNIESFLHALEIQDIYKDILHTRLIAVEQIASVGAVAKSARQVEEQTIIYRYKNTALDVIIGEGVIEIGESRSISEYVKPLIKDIIKGSIIQFGILEGWIKGIIQLATITFNISLVITENGRIRDVKVPILRNTTIPTKSSCNIYLEPYQKIMIEIDNVRITSDISQYFSKITEIECDCNQLIKIKGFKNNQAISIPLSKLIANCQIDT